MNGKNNMTDFEINLEIAKSLGWKVHPKDKWIISRPKFPNSVQPIHTIPDYCNDLNALYDAVKKICNTDELQERWFIFMVYPVRTKKQLMYKAFTMPIRNQAIALLKTLDKWPLVKQKKNDNKQMVYLIEPLEHGNGGLYGSDVIAKLELKEALKINPIEVYFDNFYEPEFGSFLKLCKNPNLNDVIYNFNHYDNVWEKCENVKKSKS